MKLYFRHAAVGATLVVGTAAAHAQTVITREVIDAPAPPPIIAAPPAETVITREVVPAETVVTEPTRTVEEEEVVTRRAPVRRHVVRHHTTTAVRHVTRRVRHAVNLTPTEQRTVYRTIVHERTPEVVGEAVEPAPVPVDYPVGAALPAAVPLYPVPGDVAAAVPVVEPYDYALVNDRVLLVDPATHVVVSEVYQ